jgi:hypothetical protein
LTPRCDLTARGGFHAVNLHAHSTASDGRKTPRQIADFADSSKTYIAITDHNSVEAHRQVTSSHILAGVEVSAGRSGVDVLVYGERDELLAFFDERVAPHLDPQNPVFRPIDREPIDVIDDALQANLHVVLPHYAIPDGIGFLDDETQRRIARMPVIVELNGQLSARRNAKAAAFAAAFGLPLIAADDTHCGDYARTVTYVPLPGIKPSTTAFFAAIKDTPRSCRMKLREPTRHERLCLARQAIRGVGLPTMTANAAAKTLFAIDQWMTTPHGSMRRTLRMA